MAAETFADVWRTVRLHVPLAPFFLVQDWTQRSWKQLCGTRPWSFLRAELALTISPSRAVAVGVTLGSPLVTSAAAFLAADAGRQFRVTSQQPTYTILSMDTTSQLTLDRAYGDATASASATILDAYATMSEDFGHFLLIADPYNQRRLAYWIDQDQLNILDPARTSSDYGPRLLAARAPSTYVPTLGRIQYEYWPYPTSARTYPYLYVKRPQALADTDPFTGVLAAGAVDTITLGALAQAARWPGATTEDPNPYFNLALAREQQKEFDDSVQVLGLADDNQYGSDLIRVHWERWPLADLAYNDKSLRATDATVADLY